MIFAEVKTYGTRIFLILVCLHVHMMNEKTRKYVDEHVRAHRLEEMMSWGLFVICLIPRV